MLVGGAQSTGEYVSNPQKYYGLTSELHCNRVVGCGAWVVHILAYPLSIPCSWSVANGFSAFLPWSIERGIVPYSGLRSLTLNELSCCQYKLCPSKKGLLLESNGGRGKEKNWWREESTAKIAEKAPFISGINSGQLLQESKFSRFDTQISFSCSQWFSG